MILSNNKSNNKPIFNEKSKNHKKTNYIHLCNNNSTNLSSSILNQKIYMYTNYVLKDVHACNCNEGRSKRAAKDDDDDDDDEEEEEEDEEEEEGMKERPGPVRVFAGPILSVLGPTTP